VRLSASYVLPEHFESKQWFRVLIPGSVWFYHRPCRQRVSVDYHHLTSTLDEDLHPITGQLTRLGLSTGPSCAGHAVKRPGSLATYFKLLGDQIAVQSSGVMAQDVETSEQLLWLDPEYRLPWECGEDFFQQARRNQLQGYLPVYGQEQKLHTCKKQLLGVRYMEVACQGNRCVLRVRAPSLGLQRFAWLQGAKALGW
jgi:hypothetical protein